MMPEAGDGAAEAGTIGTMAATQAAATATTPALLTIVRLFIVLSR
jgi:hypothetical protein